METTVFDAPTICLLALAALVAGLFLRGVSVADAPPGSGPRSRRVLPAALGLALWLGLTGMMAATGRLLDENSMPPPFARIMVPGLILVFAAAFSGFGRRLASRLGYAALIGFQAFRLPLEGLLWWFHRQGRLPVQMTFGPVTVSVASITGIFMVVVSWHSEQGSVTLIYPKPSKPTLSQVTVIDSVPDPETTVPPVTLQS